MWECHCSLRIYGSPFWGRREMFSLGLKGHMDTSTDTHCFIEEIRVGRTTVVGINCKRDMSLALAHKVAIWCTILVSMPSWA